MTASIWILVYSDACGTFINLISCKLSFCVSTIQNEWEQAELAQTRNDFVILRVIDLLQRTADFGGFRETKSMEACVCSIENVGEL